MPENIKKKISDKHVLVVDDEDLFRNALASTLKHEGYKVTAVQHGKLAQDVIGLEKVDAVISDINMPGMSGIELLHQLKKTNPELPVVLMTGFSDLKETTEAYDLGAKGFLAKPFKKEELLELLKVILADNLDAKDADVSEENQDLNYCKLSIDDFISGKEIKFDIYVRLSATKYVKIAHQGEDMPVERIRAYKGKNIRFLFMRKEDFRKYLGMNLTLLPLVNASDAISKEKKDAFIRHTNEVILENIYLNEVTEETFENAKMIVESSVSLLSDSNDLFGLLKMLNSHTDHLYAHSVAVSMYSVMIAKEMHWTSPANIYKVAMGGLLHDIGKKEVPREILDKARKAMTPEEVKMYETHPYRGMEILNQLSSVPSDVLQIVLQHHENCLGLGYPMKLSKNRTHPMARLVCVANEFCKLVVKGPDGPRMTPHDALQRMHTVQSDRLDSTFFSALMRVFKFSPPSSPL